MIIKSFTGILAIFLISYFVFGQKKIKFIVLNKSSESFDSLIIRSHNLNEVFLRFKPGDSICKKVEFYGFPGNGEGGFSISIYQKDSLVYGDVFGYFFNSSYVKENYKITVSTNRIVKIDGYP